MAHHPDTSETIPLDERPGSARVFTIPPDMPFLRTLADQLAAGKLVPGFSPASDPLALADCTIYLPTRRAARALSLDLLQTMEALTGSKAVILPRIRTLGDMGEEEQLDNIGSLADETSGILQEMAGVISPVERQLALARLAKGWIGSMKPETRALFEEEHIVLPSSAADALRLAGDLANFMDQVETEEADWSAISGIVEREHAQWWEVTLRFLDIIMQVWPAYLADRDKTNPAAFRRRIADHRIERLKTNPPKGPVIAAGSTGSIPSTARLLQYIAGMENGCVVLPGLDRDLPPEIVRRFSENREMDTETASSTHPQYAMVRLLKQMRLTPKQVAELGSDDAAGATRDRVLNICLRPAGETGNWLEQRKAFGDETLMQAFDGVRLIEAPGERAEALAIALVLREALASDEKTAALVTPDRELARRVSGELERFGIEIDDSAGFSLVTSPAAMQVRHLMRIVFGRGDAASWSGFFNGSLARQICGDRYTGKHGNLLELLLIRDCLMLPDSGDLADSVEVARERVLQADHAPRLLKTLTPEDWASLSDAAGELSAALLPLIRLFRSAQPIRVSDLACGLTEVLSVTGEITGPTWSLFEETGGEALLRLLQSHQGAGETGFEFHVNESVSVLDALLAAVPVHETSRTHPRLQIFGTLEARLQHVDRVILGGLNEGVWPPALRNDPFLNRPMRSGLGLPLPERRIGLAAHDFIQLSGKREVFYTRAKRQGDAPSIASRWLQRMETFLGRKQVNAMRRRGSRYLRLGDSMDRSDAARPTIERTSASPPLEARPTRLSITEIETWIRDPYAIYAKHVLGLRPLPDLVREADPALRGTLYHAIFAQFIQQWQRAITPDAGKALSRIADEQFARQALPPEINALWRPRFDGVARGFLRWENDRRVLVAASHCEIPVKAEIGDTGFTLRGRADRIDITPDGALIVLDYKTGGHPSKAQARTLSPQLSLEGALVKRGCFESVPASDLAGLEYIRLREDEQFKVDDITKDGRKQAGSPNELADAAYEKLVSLIDDYRLPEQGYISRYAPVSEKEITGDYDHLARVREWSIAEAEGGGEEE